MVANTWYLMHENNVISTRMTALEIRIDDRTLRNVESLKESTADIKSDVIISYNNVHKEFTLDDFLQRLGFYKG